MSVIENYEDIVIDEEFARKKGCAMPELVNLLDDQDVLTHLKVRHASTLLLWLLPWFLTTKSGAQLYTKKWWWQGSGTYGERVEREPITGVWGQSPQRDPKAEPLVGGQLAKPPWSWKVSSKSVQNFPHIIHICKGRWATLPTKKQV